MTSAIPPIPASSGEEGKSTPATPPTFPMAPPLISIDDFAKLSLRVGVITAAQPHPNADRLLVLTVDIGDGPARQVVAGIKASYQPEQLVGKQVIVVANLKPATLRGVESQGMVLAASDPNGIVLMSPERPVRVGSTVK